MKILTTIHNPQNLNDLIKVADGFILGDQRFAKALTFDLNKNMIFTIKTIYEAKKLVFILLNKIYTDQELLLVKTYIQTLPVEMITGFIGADIGLISVLASLNLTHKFVYNPETLLTNDADFNDLASLHIKGAFVSKEITLEDILEIGQLKAFELFYFGHGHMSMFYSKRKLLKTFSDYKNDSNMYQDDKCLTLKEAKRNHETYPILEDYAGTHVFRGNVFDSFNALLDLKTVVDYFIVDTLFLSDTYAIDIISMYKEGQIDTLKLEKYHQTYHDGFLFDESTIKGDVK